MEYGSVAVLDFLAHAGNRGMLPSATAGALAVACRTVFEILDAEEAADLRQVDLDAVVKRFENKRARDFNPASLKEYGRRVRRAWGLFTDWNNDPANFAPKTRATAAKKPDGKPARRAPDAASPVPVSAPVTAPAAVSSVGFPSPELDGVYATAFPVRRGHMVTITNVPADLTSDEAERLAAFMRLLASQG
jgi:hypothetical protein